jgi:hypothetical protein
LYKQSDAAETWVLLHYSADRQPDFSTDWVGDGRLRILLNEDDAI